MSELKLPFKQARNYHAGRIDRIRFIVVHSAETQELHTSAEGVQNYFAGTTREASAHVTADDNSLVRSVHDWDTAWAAPGVNSSGLHLEQAGRAAQDREHWLDAYSKRMIEQQSSRMVADWSHRHEIPLLKRHPDDVRAGRSGVIAHYDATAAFNTPGGHTDPGANYPWGRLLDAAREHLPDVARPKRHSNPYDVPKFDRDHRPFSKGARGEKVKFVQWALSIHVDGDFGEQTFKSVRAFQRKHNLSVDGVVGPQTAAALSGVTRVW